MNRTDFQQLAKLRFSEARSLLDSGFPDGAYYLAGYSVECALKACIAKRTQEHDFPDKKLVHESHTHRLTDLMKLSELFSVLRTESDPRLQNWWTTVQEWSEESRYKRWNAVEAERLLDAIENQIGGILPWIKLHW
ncbi:HEPN domain-containing protein [Acidicapsa ligni]|uniref:HEPN domain-containing protein n=1 Tax=Acidicapsa ligni TaxID=542300 RepID=UPI0021E01CD9|nr:HEPN domain-containing protein [Acidicapsa ligni]